MFRIPGLDDIARAGFVRFPVIGLGALGAAGHGIVDRLSKSRNALAYPLMGIERPTEPDGFERIVATPGILSLRVTDVRAVPGTDT